MSNVSADSVGIPNYVVKRDFRRVLDHEVRSEGYDYFWPNTALPIGSQPFPQGIAPPPRRPEPITMVHQARKPNGDLAIICATPTTIYRYYSLSDGDYYQGNGTPAEYFDSNDPNGPYYQSTYGAWIMIGSGFSATAQRWEAIDVNGLTVLNNGVDLPVTYDVSDFSVKPIYELREVGIAAVGNITESNGYLLCADVQEISQDALTVLLSLISSGTITASQVGSYGPSPFTATLIAGTVTSAQPIFSLASVGQSIQFTSGISTVITGYTSTTKVTVADVTDTINPGQIFFLINPGNQDYIVSASAPIFTFDMVGQMIAWSAGASRTIVSVIDSQHVVVDTNFSIPSGTFGTTNPNAYKIYNDTNNISRIQYRIINGIPFEARRWGATVPGTILAGSVILQLQYPLQSLFELVGRQVTVLGAGTLGGNLTATLVSLSPDAMTAILDTPAVTSSPATATVLNGVVTTAAQLFTSQMVGSRISFTNGSTSTISAFISTTSVRIANITLNIHTQTTFWFPTTSEPNFVGALVQAADATGANIGFIDLQDDGSGIIGMLELLGNLVVYKDTSIFLGNYTGTIGAPFNFSNNTVYRGSKTLYYRNTLTQVTTKGQQFHIFAGRTSFYRYDLVYQQPMEVETLEVCKDAFYNAVGVPEPLDPLSVFAFDNPITKEVWFCFPQWQGPDYTLRFDYLNIQASTSSIQITAGAATKRPESALQVGTTEDWITMGLPDGSMAVYGLTGIGAAEAANPINLFNTRYVTVVATQLGNTVTTFAPFFTSDIAVNQSIQWPDGTVVNVVQFLDTQNIIVGGTPITRTFTPFSVLPAVWHRLGQPYTSVMQSGLDNFGNEFGEKDLESWVIALASISPNTPFFFELLGTINPNNAAVVLGNYTFTNPKIQSAIGMMFCQNYFQDRITVNGINNPMAIIARLYNIAGVNSKAFTRR